MTQESDFQNFILCRREGYSLTVSLGTLLISLVIIFTFFMAYNRFLVDAAIGNLEQSLSQVASVQSVDDMKTLKFFMDDLLVTELGEKNPDPKKFTGLEFSKSIASEAKDFRQIRDVKFILQDVLSDRQKQRKPWLRFIDQALAMIKGWFGMSGKLTETSNISVRRGRNLNPEEKELYERAKDYDQKWEITQAIRSYEELVQKAYDYKDLVDIQLDLAYAYAKLGRYDKAQSLLSRLKNQCRGSREENIVDVLMRRVQGFQEVSKEIGRLQVVAAQTKDDYDLQQIYFKTGMLYYKVFDFKKAEESFKAASTVIPDNAQAVKALFYLGISLKSHSKLEKAVEIFEEIMDRFPKSEYAVYSRYQLADTHRKTGDYEKAAEEFKTIAVNFSGTSVAPLSQFRAGYVYFYDMGDPVRATDSFEKMRSTFADNRFARYATQEISPYAKSMVRDFAFILLEKGLYADARSAFQEAIQMDKKDAWSYGGLATALAFMGEKEAALQMADRAVKIEADEYTIGALAYVNELNGEYYKAIDFYKKSLKIKSDYAPILYNLGRLQEFAGRYDEAIEAYRKVAKLAKNDDRAAEVYINLGHAYWYKGKFLDAEEQFQRAVTLKPDSVLAHYNLAAAYEAENKNDLAAREYETVLHLNPNFQQAKIALGSLKRGR